MHCKPLCLLLLVSCGGILQAQLDVDSLLRELKKAPEDTGKVVLYRMLTGIVKNTDPAKAIEYGNAGVSLGKKLNFDRGVAGCYLNISAAYSDASKIDSALINVDSAIVWSHVSADANRLALAYLNRADFNMQIRNLKQSLKDCETALLYAEKADNNDRRARILQTFGSVYYYQENYPQSQDYYQKALQLYDQIGNKRMAAIVLNNIGNIYKHNAEPLKAVEHFKRAIVIADSLQDIVNLSMYYGNLSDARLEAGQYTLAEEAANRSMEFAKKQNNEKQEGMVHARYSEIYLRQEKIAEAIRSATLSYEIMKASEDLGWQQTVADLLAEAYSRQGNFQKAYQFEKISKELKDSVTKLQFDEDIASMQTRFKVEEKNKEILLLNKDRQLQAQQISRQRLLFIGSVVLAILSLAGIGLLISRYRLRQRMKEMQLRNQIAADLHDEVGSSLSSICMLSEMASSQQDGSQKEILGKVTTYTRETMDKMGDIVWMIKPVEREALGLRERMERFLFEVCNSRNIECSFDVAGIEHLKLDMQQRKGLYLIFKEAVNNAAKYSDAKHICVSLKDEHRMATLMIKDDGKGFDSGKARRGNGLTNMQTRARELKGQFNIKSEQGAGTEITFAMPC